ncbi:phospholipase [Peterkaempfera sp. SMS 1(5)a]|uniref:phospholipase n=1 Tax=Peterkaempfera podocarpi TaxID=3232308 RepID=UPI003671CC2C
MRVHRAAAAVVAAAALLLGPATAPAHAVPAPGTTLYVQSAVNGYAAADAQGTLAAHRPKGNEDHQQWILGTAADGAVELRSADEAGRCLGRGGSQTVTVACGDPAASWDAVPQDAGRYALRAHDGSGYLTLQPPGSDGTHPAPLQVGADGPLARWYLTPAPLPTAPAPAPDQRTLDQVTFLTAHNAYANGVDGGFAPPFVNFFPNQSRGISQQLADGVSGFMLDIHQTPDGAILCHDSCTLVSRPVALWVDLQRIVDFLRQHPGRFATVFLEDYVSTDVLGAELARVNGLGDLLYRPDQDGVRDHGWPSMAALAARGKQLMIFTDRTRAADSADGRYRDALGVMYQNEWTVENYWSMGSGAGSSDWSCYSRWYGIPLTREEPAFHPLFVMNHFRDATLAATASSDNSKLLNRAENFCDPAARKKPTYVAVDRYDLGNPQSAVDRLNSYLVAP